MFNDFEQWWHDTGSGITPENDEDQETHAKRVAFAAWLEMKERAVVEARIMNDLDIAQSIELLR